MQWLGKKPQPLLQTIFAFICIFDQIQFLLAAAFLLLYCAKIELPYFYIIKKVTAIEQWCRGTNLFICCRNWMKFCVTSCCKHSLEHKALAVILFSSSHFVVVLDEASEYVRILCLAN